LASKIFVGNLSFKTTRDELQQLFGQIGPIDDVFIPTDRETSRPRGFAFITFTEDDHAKEAITRFNEHQLDGRALRVNAAEEKPRRAPGSGGGGFAGRPGNAGGGGGGYGGGDRDSGYSSNRSFGGGGGSSPFEGGKAKGSRRNLRAKKRSL
jgi:cold-inducible RNA-binding protein